MRYPIVLLPALGLVMSVGPVAAQATPVGQLLEVRGAVSIRHAGQQPAAGRLFSPLQAGDRIRVGARGAAELVLFQNGARFAMPAGSAAVVSALRLTPRSGPAPRSLPGISVAFLRGMRRAPAPVSSRLRRFLGTVVRGGPDDPHLGPRDPSPNGAVPTGPVTLRWAGVIEGEQLHLQISDGEQTLYETDLPPTARQFPVPEGVLRPGAYYGWSVTAVQGMRSGRSCRALVRRLTPEEATLIARLEQEAAAARAAAPDDPAPLLLLAQSEERLGRFEEARTAYQTVLRLRPQAEGVAAALQRLPGSGSTGERRESAP